MPDDPIKLTDEMAKAGRAKDVLENPAFRDAYEAMRRTIVEAWERSPARDSEGRERLWAHLKALESIKGQLEVAVANGKQARHTLQLIERERNGATSGNI